VHGLQQFYIQKKSGRTIHVDCYKEQRQYGIVDTKLKKWPAEGSQKWKPVGVLDVGVNIKSHNKSAQRKSDNAERPDANITLIFRSKKKEWYTEFGGKNLGNKGEKYQPEKQHEMTPLYEQGK